MAVKHFTQRCTIIGLLHRSHQYGSPFPPNKNKIPPPSSLLSQLFMYHKILYSSKQLLSFSKYQHYISILQNKDIAIDEIMRKKLLDFYFRSNCTKGSVFWDANQTAQSFMQKQKISIRLLSLFVSGSDPTGGLQFVTVFWNRPAFAMQQLVSWYLLWGLGTVIAVTAILVEMTHNETIYTSGRATSSSSDKRTRQRHEKTRVGSVRKIKINTRFNNFVCHCPAHAFYLQLLQIQNDVQHCLITRLSRKDFTFMTPLMANPNQSWFLGREKCVRLHETWNRSKCKSK